MTSTTPSTDVAIPDEEECVATKKKERVVVAPPCPTAVATAYLVLRGAITAVTGAAVCGNTTNPEVCAAASVLQATYLKENVLSGKFSMSLGKKLGDLCELDLPETSEGTDELLTAIENAANRIIQENRCISCYSTTKANIVSQYGEACLDASHKKTNDDAQLTVSYIDHWILAVAPSIPYASTGCIRRITFDRTQCGVSAAKKARSKADVTLKFLAEDDIDHHTTKTSSLLAIELDTVMVEYDVHALSQAKIRCVEGIELRNLQLAAAMHIESDQPVDDAATVTILPVDDTASGDLDDEMVVNIEEVKGKIDYTKLVDQFGSTLIDAGVLEQLHAETVGKGRVPVMHRFLRRGMFFSHRDLHNLLNAIGTGTPMYLYTGRGPSSESMHLGHLIPFLFTKWLQDALDAPLVIQMTDDEKFIFKGTYDEHTGDDLDRFAALTIENARDIIACGFDYKKTFIFSDLEYVGRMYPNIVRIWKSVTTNAVTNIFGFDGSSNIGKVAFPAIQAAPSFASSFPVVLNAHRDSEHMCLIPCAIDQDPYFRMTRDIAHKMVHKKHKLSGKPALIHSKFFPPLQGATGKMSSSNENSAVFLTDSPEDIKNKIMHHAFSGGRETKAKQQELGADLEVDVSYQWLRFFLEDDDELARIGASYGSGQGDFWSTGSVKARLIEVLQRLVAEHQQRRATITDEEVRKWMTERSIV
jgi:tryptophanyl-tRNA synthetase